MNEPLIPGQGEVILRLSIEEAEAIARREVGTRLSLYARLAIEQTIHRALEDVAPDDFDGIPGVRKPKTRKFVGGSWRS